jgi:hypothetical protein
MGSQKHSKGGVDGWISKIGAFVRVQKKGGKENAGSAFIRGIYGIDFELKISDDNRILFATP